MGKFGMLEEDREVIGDLSVWMNPPEVPDQVGTGKIQECFYDILFVLELIWMYSSYQTYLSQNHRQSRYWR